MTGMNSGWLQRYRGAEEYVIRGDEKKGERTGVRWDGAMALLRSEQVASDKRLVRVAATTEQRDRANDRIVTAGIDVSIWENTNPVFLWSHDQGWGSKSEPAIGTGGNAAKLVNAEGLGVLEVDCLFHHLTPLSLQISNLVDAKVIRTVSIGLIPLDYEDSLISEEDYEQQRIYPNWSNEFRDYTLSEMIECSFCNIPMNPGARVLNAFQKEFQERLTDAVHRGVLPADAEFIQRMGNGKIELNENKGDTRRAGVPLGKSQRAAGSSNTEDTVDRAVENYLERAGKKISASRIARLNEGLGLHEEGSAQHKKARDIIKSVIAEAEADNDNEEKSMVTPVNKAEGAADGSGTESGGATLDDVVAAIQGLGSKIDAIDVKITAAEEEDAAEDAQEEEDEQTEEGDLEKMEGDEEEATDGTDDEEPMDALKTYVARSTPEQVSTLIASMSADEIADAEEYGVFDGIDLDDLE